VTNKEFHKKVEGIATQTGSVVVALQLAQKTYGYITEKAIEIISEVFNESRSTVYGTASFYHQFSFVPKGRNIISVCMGTACFVCGSENILRGVETELGIRAGEVTRDGLFSIEENTRCLGDCANAPIVTINDKVIRQATEDTVINEIRKIKTDSLGVGKL
jgi:NADH-quinone oxidoreductase subunit E